MRIPFQAFDPHGEVRIYYHGKLPNWRQNHATYFVTFRLGDSIPKTILDELEESLSSPDRLSEKEERRRRRKLETCLDQGHGSCLLKSKDVRQTLENKIRQIPRSKALIGDFVIMPNHVHLLLVPHPSHELETILKTIKGASAVEINRQLNRTGKLWQRKSYERIVRDIDHLRRCRNYIARNPEKAALTPESSTLYQADWRFEGE